MTKHVRTSYRRHRRGAWAAVLAVLVIVGLAVVLPAVGANGDPIPPRSDPAQVLPRESLLAGSTFSCSSISAPHASQQWQIASLSPGTTTTYTLTATNGKTAKLTVTVAGGNNNTNDKYMSFRIVGGRISDIGLKGGSKTAVYHYGDAAAQWADADGWGGAGGSAGTVNADGSVSGLTVEAGDTDNDTFTGLHATLDNQSKLYQLSWTTVCWEPVVKISGTIYRDTNGDGSTTGDSGIAHQVSLNNGTPITTGADGTYSFVVPSGGTYLVCAPAVTAPPNSEVQTKPVDPNTTPDACASGDGYSFSNLTEDRPNSDFAFAGGVTASCLQNGGSVLHSQFNAADANATVDAKFYSAGTSCKANNQQFVFTTYTTNSGSTRVAKLAAVNPLGGHCVLATPADCVIYAERITWSFTATDVPDLKQLSYDDTAEGGTSGPMKFCKKDPFDRSANPNDGVTLHTPLYPPTDILPSAVNGGYESSCLARTTQYRPSGDPVRVDETYSAYDSGKNLG